MVPRAGVRVLLRPADPQDADLEDARRAALPVPRRAGRRLGGARRGRGADRQPPRSSGSPGSCAAGGAGVGHGRSWSTTSAGPARFLNMLRVFKPTSPLSVGSWILAPFAALVRRPPPRRRSPAGCLGWGGSPAWARPRFGPPLATYTAALFANTAVPAWHEAHRELPFVFAGSGAGAAGGLAHGAGTRWREPARPGGWRSPAPRWSSRPRRLMERRLGHARRALRAGPLGAADAHRVAADRGRRQRCPCSAGAPGS